MCKVSICWSVGIIKPVSLVAPLGLKRDPKLNSHLQDNASSDRQRIHLTGWPNVHTVPFIKLGVKGTPTPQNFTFRTWRPLTDSWIHLLTCVCIILLIPGRPFVCTVPFIKLGLKETPPQISPSGHGIL